MLGQASSLQLRVRIFAAKHGSSREWGQLEREHTRHAQHCRVEDDPGDLGHVGGEPHRAVRRQQLRVHLDGGRRRCVALAKRGQENRTPTRSRSDLDAAQIGDVLAAVDGVPVAGLDDYYFRRQHVRGCTLTLLRRSPHIRLDGCGGSALPGQEPRSPGSCDDWQVGCFREETCDAKDVAEESISPAKMDKVNVWLGNYLDALSDSDRKRAASQAMAPPLRGPQRRQPPTASGAPAADWNRPRAARVLEAGAGSRGRAGGTNRRIATL
mmetsp:Transcript_25515/g.82192  ORF Transcript_25515/g.82192 Transcript_25515/m.82192 type:complete len:268 (+) Transcript_25515:892-1695(+)